MANEDYKNNPLYTDITNLDSTPSPTFSYNWSVENERWEPAGPVSIDSINISGDLNIDMGPTNDILSDLTLITEGSNLLLEGISGELSNIHVDVSLDSDEVTHDLLAKINSDYLINVGKSNEILNDLNKNLSGINVEVAIDSDTQAHEILSGISGELANLETEDSKAHEILSGISGELANLETEDSKAHEILSGISGELANLETEDSKAHEILLGISGELANLETEDSKAHEILLGISGELANLEINVDNANTNALLSSISGKLHNSTLATSNEESNNLLIGISGELANLDVNVDNELTNKLLSSMSGSLINIDEVNSESINLLQAISGGFSDITINAEIDTSSSDLILSGISGELSNLETDDSKTHNLLSGISGELSNLKTDDSNTHQLLSGISGELSQLNLETDDIETHELLSGISGELLNINTQIQRRELYQPWKLKTKTVSQKIEEDFLLMEDIPESARYGHTYGECFGQDKDVMEDVFGVYFKNGRTNKSEPETGHPNYFIHAEYTDPNRCVSSKDVFHSDSLFGLRLENESASLINSYELKDYNNLYERGLVDHVILYNESPYPIQFHTAERRLNKSEPVSPITEDIIFLDSDMAVKINADEAGSIFVKRPHTISGYTVKYSIVYKETGSYDNLN